MKEAIFFCIVGLPLFGKEGSGTPVFKILVRALHPKLDFAKMNAYIEFGEILPIGSQDIERKRNFGVNKGP